MKSINALLINLMCAFMVIGGLLVIFAIFVLFIRDAKSAPSDWLQRCEHSKEAYVIVYTVNKLIEIDCRCKTQKSIVVMNENNECMFWYFADVPEKKNPCERIPDNATPVWIEDNKEVNP